MRIVYLLLLLGSIIVYPVREGDTLVCGEGVNFREGVCIVLDGYNICNSSDDYGHFCIDARRPLVGGETFSVGSSWSGEVDVTVLWNMLYLPLLAGE